MSGTHRAKIRLLAALALSVALHAVLLSIRMMSPGNVAPSMQPLEVRLGYLRATPENMREPLRVDPAPAPFPPSDTATPRPRRPVGEAEESTTSDVLPPGPPDRIPPVGRGPDIAPPVPFPAGTSLWSPAARRPDNAEAAYVAQREHQALLNQQALMQAARGQYEVRLMESLHRQRVIGSCKIVLPNDGKPHARCDHPPDTASIVAVLNELGKGPPTIDAPAWFVVELAPGGSEVPPRLISRRVDYDPDQ